MPVVECSLTFSPVTLLDHTLFSNPIPNNWGMKGEDKKQTTRTPEVEEDMRVEGEGEGLKNKWG